MSIDDIIKHLENNECIPSFDKSFYIEELNKFKKSDKDEDDKEDCPEGECCPHCDARLERGDNGKCNRCGKPWPIKEDIFSIIESKIADSSVTTEDFDRYINEAFKSSVVDRVQRRVRKNETDNHIDNSTGHQPLSEPHMSDRVTPRVAKKHSQMHHRGKSGHDRSTRTQQRNAATNG